MKFVKCSFAITSVIQKAYSISVKKTTFWFYQDELYLTACLDILCLLIFRFLFSELLDALLTIIIAVDRLDDVFINYFHSISTFARLQHMHFLERDRFFADLKMCKRVVFAICIHLNEKFLAALFSGPKEFFRQLSFSHSAIYLGVILPIYAVGTKNTSICFSTAL